MEIPIPNTNKTSDINEYLNSLCQSTRFAPQIVARKTLNRKDEVLVGFPEDMDKELVSRMVSLGYSSLYSHQREAIDIIRNRENVIVSTPTASGKSLIYNLCVFEQLLKNTRAHALYLFPLKALAQDQLRVLNTFGDHLQDLPNINGQDLAQIYDGDTSSYKRSQIRKNTPSVLLSNPDMVHLSFLPYHESWSHFFANLRFLVIDEVHTYRGIFGSHMSWVTRRLLRLARHYGANPVIILLSATIGNPKEFGEKLLSQPVKVVKKSGAPQSAKHIVLFNPWDSAAHTAGQMVEAAVKRKLRTIVYTQSRKMTELITLWTRPKLGEMAQKLSAYRAGFLPEERREIEKQLANGDLLAVISTSALELGIDIGDLDLCLLVGYPGSIMASYQRGGRVGRGKRDSLVILIAQEDALDQHFMRNPDDFFARDVESAVINPFNQTIMSLQLTCAAAELPLKREETFLQQERILKDVEELCHQSILLQSQSGEEYFSSRKYPQREINLRGGGNQLVIIDSTNGEIVGEIDSLRALKECHPGALYLHRAKSWLIEKLDLGGKEVIGSESKLPYYTRAMSNKATEIIDILSEKTVFGHRVCFGNLKVTEQVTGYQKRNTYTAKLINSIPLDLPEQLLETEGVWIEIDKNIQQSLEKNQTHFMGSIHAMEHGMIAMFPLLILCDRNDIGGISCVIHEQTEKATIFIYDGYTGGVGLCSEAYNRFENLIKQTYKTISSCLCETGCPSCVHSPKCGSGNRPIDKPGCLTLLEKIINNHGNDRPIEEKKKVQRKVTTRIKPAQQEQEQGLSLLPPRYGLFDVETKRSAQEVGGWNKAEEMGISVAVVYDSELDGYITYLEDEIDNLVAHLFELDLVVGFNNKRFDNRVLSRYTHKDLSTLPNLDLLEEVHHQLGYRLSLNGLAQHTLGVEKSADGLQALKWYKQGEIAKIVHYCRKDVEITRNLFLHALDNGYLLFQNKSKKIVRLPLNLEKTIQKVKRG